MRTFTKPYKPRLASRKDFSHTKTFGAAPLDLPSELLNITPIVNQGSLPACSAAASVANRRAIKGREYDFLSQWKLELDYLGVKDAPDGVAKEVPAEVGLKVGFVPVGTTTPTDKVGGYFWKNRTPNMDWFDTYRYTQYQLYQRTGKIIPLQVAMNWFRSWDVQGGIVPDIETNLLGGHDTLFAGFTNKNGADYLVNQNSWGENVGDKGLFYFNRAITNKYLGMFGIFYWLDIEDMPLEVRRKGIFSQILQNMSAILKLMLQFLTNEHKITPVPVIPIDATIPPPVKPVPMPVLPPNEPLQPVSPPKPTISPFLWDTPSNALISVRRICDNEGLSVQQKNELDATVKCESGYNPNAIGKINSDGSQDFGIAQFNNKRWIGAGLPFPSTDYVLSNPEICIRKMCKLFKSGHAGWWMCHNKLFGSVKVACGNLCILSET